MNTPLFLSHLFLSPSSLFPLSFTKHRVGRREFMHSSRDSYYSRGLVLLCSLEKSISFGQGIYHSIILCKHTNRSPFIGTFAICLSVCLIYADSPPPLFKLLSVMKHLHGISSPTSQFLHRVHFVLKFNN